MTEQLRAFAWRPIFLVTQGLVVGALATALLSGSGSGAEAVTTYTRTVSCAAVGGFHPINSSTTYAFANERTMLFRLTENGSGYFVCDPGLPHKAVVTRIRFTILDDTAYYEVRNCALVRGGLAPATAESVQVLASVPATGVAYYNHQPLRYSTTSISYATIDNANFAYWLQCELPTNLVRLGIYGADVTYKITAGNG
jgi:hypothetical protein